MSVKYQSVGALIVETLVNGYGKLVLNSLIGDIEPVLFVVKQLALIYADAYLLISGDQTCCSIQYSLQLISNYCL